MKDFGTPNITRTDLYNMLLVEIDKLDRDKYPVVLVGIRGYFKHTNGQEGVNERGIYDDAIGVIERCQDGAYLLCNGNTDPTDKFKPGLATLKAGTWLYRRGKHGISKGAGYDAFVQAKPVTVTRDGEGDDTGMFTINIHRGGVNTTGSLGCQTIPPAQWPAFQNLGYMLTKKYGMDIIPYILVEQA